MGFRNRCDFSGLNIFISESTRNLSSELYGLGIFVTLIAFTYHEIFINLLVELYGFKLNRTIKNSRSRLWHACNG